MPIHFAPCEYVYKKAKLIEEAKEPSNWTMRAVSSLPHSVAKNTVGAFENLRRRTAAIHAPLREREQIAVERWRLMEVDSSGSSRTISRFCTGTIGLHGRF